jgi:hypothetical protein
MAISFEPSQHHLDAGESFDIRMRLVDSYAPSKSSRAKSMAVDFRVHPDCVKAWGLRSGDKIVGRMEDDGSWVFSLVMPSEKGYVVRIGGLHGNASRKGFAFFRFSMTPAAARVVFPDARAKELEFVGVEGRQAMFTPCAVKSGVEFVPAR